MKAQLSLLVINYSLISPVMKNQQRNRFMCSCRLNVFSYWMFIMKSEKINFSSVRRVCSPKILLNCIRNHCKHIYFRSKLKINTKSGGIRQNYIFRIIKHLPQLTLLKKTLKEKFPQSPLIFSFPQPQQSQLNQTYAKTILQLFIAFLGSIAKSQVLSKQKPFLLFIENWVSQDKKKVKTFFQRTLMKKAGGRHTESNLLRIMYNFVSWRHKFFTVTNQGVFYTDNEDSFEVRQMLFFNQSFSIIHGQIKTGYTFGLVINSSHRVLQVDTQNVYKFLLFIYLLRKAFIRNQGSKTNRYNSFAQVRQNCCESTFYIDGENYFKAMSQQFKKAKKQVFITGWFLSPHMYLVQKYDDLQERIDKTLESLAKRGIKIYIIVYDAPKIALDTDPQFTEKYLMSLHSNIKVLRHPNYMLIPFLWSHHQKLVIVDQRIAFMGGLDIGYGRMDDNKHLLSDQQQKRWKGIEYCNYRIVDITQVQDYQKCSIDRTSEPRMPWHDVGVKIMGASVLDLCRHFIQYWNHVNFQLQLSQRQLILFTGIHQEELQSQLSFIQSGQFKQDAKKHYCRLPFESCIEPEDEDQKDQMSFKKVMQKTNKTASFVGGNSRMLYEDLPQLSRMKSTQFAVESQDPSKQSQIQYYLKHLKGSTTKQKSSILSEKPNSEGIQAQKQNKVQDLMLTQFQDSNFDMYSGRISDSTTNYCHTHQVLRSAALWGLGLQQGKQEKSILQAYYSLIDNSKHFIYIQNQFFISVQNQVSTKIAQRIMLAHQRREAFKVVIMIPFLPGFNGEVQDDNFAVIRVQLDLIYQTTCRGQNSMLRKLQQISNLKDYLGIYCLRNHGTIRGIPVTEIVYVHSKIMIIDDSIALIGSANINDRSLKGTRDSELAVVIEDSEQIHIGNQMGKLPKLKVKKFAHQLRKQLYMEHFDLTVQESEHFLNEGVWEKVQFNAERNQKIYRKIFGCYPDNNVKDFYDIKKLRQQAQPQRYEELKNLIKGFACPFQSEFLCKQSLQLHSGQKQYYIPYINFT